jgi:hypothetical protein
VAVKSSVGAAKAQGKWGIQVGAFKQRSLANTQIKLIEKRFGDAVASGDAVVSQGGGNYRAQFKGFAENDAKNACRTLVAKRQVCMVLNP